MFSEEIRMQIAIVDFIERAIAGHPEKPYVTLSELGRVVDKLAPFANSRIGARYTREYVLNDLFEREVLRKTTLQTAGRPVQMIEFAHNGWEIRICPIKSDA